MNIFRKIEETKAMVASMRREILTSDVAKAVAYDFSTLHAKLQIWAENGAKTFRLSKELIDAFTLTDVPLDVKPIEFKFPFDTFLIEGEKPLYQVDIRGNRDANVHALLFVDKKVVDLDPRTILLTREGNIQKTIEWDVSISGLSVGVNNFGLDHMWVNLRNNETVMEACNIASKVENRDVVSIPEAQRAVNIFFNTIMYINDSSRVPAETELKCSVKYKIGKGKKNTVRSEFILLKPPRKYIPIHSAKTGRTIDKRFLVRGHWTRQAYGKGHMLRKNLWILPYWKGPELAEIVSKKYKVE